MQDEVAEMWRHEDKVNAPGTSFEDTPGTGQTYILLRREFLMKEKTGIPG
jgi:hypothetical protein